MNNIIIQKGRVYTLISFVTILIPILLWGLWIHSYNSQSNQTDRLNMYLSYFPEFLAGRYTLSLISILFCLAGIFFSSIHWTFKSTLFKILGALIMISGGLTLLLTLFTLL